MPPRSEWTGRAYRVGSRIKGNAGRTNRELLQNGRFWAIFAVGVQQTERFDMMMGAKPGP